MRKNIFLFLMLIGITSIILWKCSTDRPSLPTTIKVSEDEDDSPLYSQSLKIAKKSLEGKKMDNKDPNRVKMKIIDPHCPPSWQTATCKELPCVEPTISGTTCEGNTCFSVLTCNYYSCQGFNTCDQSFTCSATCSNTITMDCSPTCNNTRTCKMGDLRCRNTSDSYCNTSASLCNTTDPNCEDTIYGPNCTQSPACY